DPNRRTRAAGGTTHRPRRAQVGARALLHRSHGDHRARRREPPTASHASPSCRCRWTRRTCRSAPHGRRPAGRGCGRVNTSASTFSLTTSATCAGRSRPAAPTSSPTSGGRTPATVPRRWTACWPRCRPPSNSSTTPATTPSSSRASPAWTCSGMRRRSWCTAAGSASSPRPP
ncbi:LOW QUALITY PROTEIN: nitrilotriacetate monooxygenase, partial [Rhodococcus opacus PD630]